LGFDLATGGDAALLDEIIAGAEANLQAIERGEAHYQVETTATGSKERSSIEKAMFPSKYSVVMRFDGSLCRWDFQHFRCYRDDLVDVVFDTFQIDRNPAARGPASSVFIYDKGHGPHSPYVYHPRYLGNGLECVTDPRYAPKSIAEILRSARQTPELTKVVVNREGALVRLVIDVPSQKAKDEYWVSPQEGYAVTQERKWATKNPDNKPYSEVSTGYRREGAAFVATRSVRTERRMDQGVQHDLYTIRTTLTMIRLDEKPDAKVFTLDDLGLPKGARVQDRRSGTETLWGIKAVTEKDVHEAMTQLLLGNEPQTAAQSRPFLSYALISGGLGIGLLILMLAIYWKRSHCRLN
jgi:hypothetical protein